MFPVHSMSPVEIDRRNLNKNDAPEGMVAVLKFDNPSGVNICTKCDHRPACLIKQGNCRDFEREDKCSVFFVDKSRIR